MDTYSSPYITHYSSNPKVRRRQLRAITAKLAAGTMVASMRLAHGLRTSSDEVKLGEIPSGIPSSPDLRLPGQSSQAEH